MCSQVQHRGDEEGRPLGLIDWIADPNHRAPSQDPKPMTNEFLKIRMALEDLYLRLTFGLYTYAHTWYLPLSHTNTYNSNILHSQQLLTV